VKLTPVAPVLRPAARLVIGTIDLLTRRDWRAANKLPDGGAVIVVNHISNVDPAVVAVFLARNNLWPQFLAKDSLFANPLLGRIFRGIAQIPVRRGTSAAGDALDSAVTAIEQGGCVVIYPEGTITTDPELWPMKAKTGAVRLARRTGCPVIPVAQWGAQQIMFGKRIEFPKFLPRKRISMLVGDPIDVSDGTAEQATAEIMAVITDLVAQLRGEPSPSGESSVAYHPDK
jgi:1-acyl-sn-glycerol-3-phosphate acyltransferase